MLNLRQPINRHELRKPFRVIDNFTTGINELAECRQKLIPIIRPLNRTAAPIDCGVFLKLVITNLEL